MGAAAPALHAVAAAAPAAGPHIPLPLPLLPPSLPPHLQIGHAGDGGLYAELVQDRSFDALAAATGFLSAPASQRLKLNLPALAARHRHAMEPLHTPWDNPGHTAYRSKQGYLRERRADTNYDPRCSCGAVEVW
jgi:hypothetical protein